jgi:hypothetical protein
MIENKQRMRERVKGSDKEGEEEKVCVFKV